MDELWKIRMCDLIPADRQYNRILDLACGTGILTFKLAEIFPHAEVIGTDLTTEYLNIAKKRKTDLGIKNVKFIKQVAEDTQFSKRFDLIISSYLPKYADLDLVIKKARTHLNTGGVLLFHDFTEPTDPLLLGCYNAHWQLITPYLDAIDWFGNEKPGTIRNVIRKSRWVEKLPLILEKHGFKNIYVENQPFQVATIVRAEKK